MIKSAKRAATVAAVAAAMAIPASSAFAATPALGSNSIHPNASYNGVCGAGYGVIDSMGVSGGTIYLAYSSATGDNCVVTVRNTPGATESMGADVSLDSSPYWNQDSGNYTTYAGPVYVYAPHACIDWGGWIGSSSNYQYDVHCG